MLVWMIVGLEAFCICPMIVVAHVLLIEMMLFMLLLLICAFDIELMLIQKCY